MKQTNSEQKPHNTIRHTEHSCHYQVLARNNSQGWRGGGSPPDASKMRKGTSTHGVGILTVISCVTNKRLNTFKKVAVAVIEDV